jgi:hypothetical protein
VKQSPAACSVRVMEIASARKSGLPDLRIYVADLG